MFNFSLTTQIQKLKHVKLRLNLNRTPTIIVKLSISLIYF